MDTNTLQVEHAPRQITISDIAAELGVTKMTVSLALSGKGRVSTEMREKVAEVARRLNYEPNHHARTLTTGNSNLIGIFSVSVYPGVQLQTIERIQGLLNEKGFDVPLYGHGYHEYLDPTQQGRIMAALCQQQPRAIVFDSKFLQPPAAERLRSYVERGGVAVCFDEDHNIPCDRVFRDFGAMSVLSVQHLLELGHRKIGLYCPSPDRRTTEPRIDGFHRALQDAGIQPNKEWILSGPAFEPGGAYLAEQFLALKSRPTAMVVIGDATAGVFMNQLFHAGVRVPDDLSVVGHHGIPAAEYWIPALTTVAYPIVSTADEIVSMLTSRLDGRYSGAPRLATMHGELVVRNSARRL